MLKRKSREMAHVLWVKGGDTNREKASLSTRWGKHSTEVRQQSRCVALAVQEDLIVYYRQRRH